ncbi:MAG TPA: hypothetical protein VNL14_16410 [Candidatus Acidoferrales bacterium]|nr:hypothetical protein [Candidatus Acidoferrales bacterium]
MKDGFRAFDSVVKLGAEAMTETRDSLCVKHVGLVMWIPKSVIDVTSEVKKKGDRGVLKISEDLARQKGIVE